ncbi:hypothetical protein RHGRI_018133 [Rhododendron griersonianum]|uniref:Ribosomal protein S15 n=1 Tax=Rhododendron griersonianum TaxID=479676 RepID=A0AAV6K0H6_9ERIC|nr:hypothetical protein RHGRI_018133 [Rhododendron griersonianum]
MKKVIEDSAVVEEGKQKQLVCHRIKNHIRKYQEAYRILKDDVKYNKLRAEVLAQPYVSYRQASPERA